MSLRWLLGLAALASIALGPTTAQAQVCTPACHADETLRSDGYCEHDSGFPTYARSHRANDCAVEAPVNRSTGICTPARGCGGGGSNGFCREHPVCQPGEEFRDGGCYPPCNAPGACSHTRAECEAGWTLDTSRGVCRLCRIPPLGGGHPPILLRPDLLFSFAPAITPPAAVLPYGRAYSICFTVKNAGALGSGPFTVRGAGLGVPVGPSRAFGSLAAGSTVSGCVRYPTTPPPGHYVVEIRIEGPPTEARIDNNAANVTVVVR